MRSGSGGQARLAGLGDGRLRVLPHDDVDLHRLLERDTFPGVVVLAEVEAQQQGVVARVDLHRELVPGDRRRLLRAVQRGEDHVVDGSEVDTRLEGHQHRHEVGDARHVVVVQVGDDRLVPALVRAGQCVTSVPEGASERLHVAEVADAERSVVLVERHRRDVEVGRRALLAGLADTDRLGELGEHAASARRGGRGLVVLDRVPLDGDAEHSQRALVVVHQRSGNTRLLHQTGLSHCVLLCHERLTLTIHQAFARWHYGYSLIQLACDFALQADIN